MDWTRIGLAGLVLLLPSFSAAVGQDRGLGEVVGGSVNQGVEVSNEENPAPGAVTGIESLNREQRIAQLMFTTLEGKLGPTRKDMMLLNSFPPGGVIILETSDPEEGAKYVNALRKLEIERARGLPLFIATDSYALSHARRGRTKAFAEMPSMLSIAAARDPKLTRALGTEIAREMKIIGFNLHLGPSLALDSGLADTAGSIQLLGSNPEIVASTSEYLFSAFEAGDLLWAPMGFPGGEASGDKKGPAVLVTAEKYLAARDLLPYARAVKAGAQVIHVGNTLVTTRREGVVPASLSRTVMRDWLRKDLGFEGVIIAGPMDGGEIKRAMSPTEAARISLLAGADMLLWSNSGSPVLRAVEALSRAIQEEELDEALVMSALDRQIALKEKHGLLEQPLSDEKVAGKLEREIAQFEVPYLIERRSITLVQNRGNVLPLAKETSLPLGITGAFGADELEKALTEYIKPVASFQLRNAKHIGRIQDFEIDRLTKNARGTRTAVCVFSNGEKLPGQVEIIRTFKQLGARVVVVYLGYPDRIVELSDADVIVLAYSNPSSLSNTMRAVAEVLVGNGPIEILPGLADLKRAVKEDIPFDVADVVRSPVGRLPISVSERFPAGHSQPYVPQLALKKARWNFGDGKSSSEMRSTHSFKEPGRYTVMLTVTDSMGNESSREFHVSVQ